MDDVRWSDLLPVHRADGDDQPVGRARRVDTMPLADSLRLAIHEDDRGRTYPVPLVATSGHRARPGDGASEALVALLADGSRRIGNVEVTVWYHSPALGERAITVDQTNESVVVGDRAVVKWTVRADDGPHPGPSLLAELARNGFTGMPRPWAAVQWHPPGGAPARLVALVVDYLPGAVDGWTWLVEELRAAAETGDQAPVRAAGAAVGELVADFHRALASTGRNSTPDEAAALRQSAIADLEQALSVTSGAPHRLLADEADRLRAVFDGMWSGATPLMRVHGDLHIGQVLRTGSTYRLTDFDGNPVVAAASRVREQPAAADLSGMAQSITHAGIVTRKHHPRLDAERLDRMARLARATFLEAYRRRLGDRADLLDERLMLPLSLRQLCREFTYAATHLPRWYYVPEATLPMLLEEESL